MYAVSEDLATHKTRVRIGSAGDPRVEIYPIVRM